ncbi:MAG TPA: HEAT repeat domain-containing protein [Methylomirabilota bacterium]|nr:HEAT repeat domain-containing protein [Methylomirabilota bacterium]
MKPFNSKFSRRAIWRFSLVALFISTLLIFAVPWQRLKVPALILCLNHGTGYTRGLAAMHLGRIDDGDPKVLVTALLPHLKDKNLYVREMTAISLGHIHQYPEQVVPPLLACIDAETNPASLVPNYALGAIGQFRTNARPWSPILVGMIESNRFHYWLNPLGALKSIDPETAKPLIEKRDADYSNGVKQAQAHFDEVARRRALFLRTNVPPTNSAAATNATHS